MRIGLESIDDCEIYLTAAEYFLESIESYQQIYKHQILTRQQYNPKIRMNHSIRISAILIVLCLCWLGSTQILAIDFGTQYVKAAVVNKGSGKVFSIVETPKSERKFINSIGFYSEERFYQYDSIPRRTRYPANCFIFTKLLIDSLMNPGLRETIKKDLLLTYIKQDLQDPLLAQFTLQHFPKQRSKLTLLEIVAMIIKYAKANAEKQIKQPIKDVVLAVPSYWNIRMRAFIIEAAQIADLHVLSLISQNTAASINYALNQRTKNTTQTILFYNLGSNSLQMSLVQFKQVAQQKSKPVQSIFVLDDLSRNYVGGLRFDSALFNFFKKRFQTKYKKELNTRGLIKLWGEINEVKQTLSANKQASLFVQGIIDGIDYNDRVTRTQFQKMIQQMLTEITAPIKRFLFDNNLKPDDIDNVEMIGGSSRIPRLQTMIGEIIGNQSKIGTHINADQAMVLGAAFYGANSSRKFKVKGMNLYDGFNFQIRAVLRNLEQDIDQSDQKYFFKNVTVFPKKSRFGLTKQLNFKCKQNIIIQLFKQDDKGIELIRSQKLDNINTINQTDFKVSILLSVDPIQIVTVKKAQYRFKKDQEVTYMEKIKKQRPKQEKQEQKQEDSDQQKEKQEQKVEQQQEKQRQQQKKEEGSDSQQQKSDDQQQTQKKKQQQKQAKKQKKKKKAPKQQYQTVQRTKIVTKKYQKDLHMQQLYSLEKADHDKLQQSRKMLKDYERIEQERRRFAESKNRLEALIYEIKDKLDNEEFLEFVQDEEKENLGKLVSQKSQWYEQTNSDNKVDYDENSKTLSKPLQKIKKRIHQYQTRQPHMKKSLKQIQQYRALSQNITKKKQWITEQQVQVLVEKIDELKQQIDNMFKKMKDTPKSESSVFQMKDFDKVVEKAKEEYYKLMAKEKPKKEKKKDVQKEKQEKDADQSEEL